MDLSFSEQVDQLLWQLKVELLKHHEHHRSPVGVPRPGQVGQVHPMPPEGTPTAPIVKPQQLAEASLGSEATSVAPLGSLMGQARGGPAACGSSGQSHSREG